MKHSFKVGDLIKVVRSGSLTLCYTLRTTPPSLRELPAWDLEMYTHASVKKENMFIDLEGNLALVVYVIRNRLDQVMGYRVLIKGKEMFCKSKVAEKYFRLVGYQDNESGGLSSV
tara:strand:+ start:706 stop:1050 length:345 start_codon:yes stop_codon:yes gene_type:complete